MKRSSAPRLGLGLAMAILLSACATARPVVFDATAVPAPPQYSPQYKIKLAAEIDAAPERALIIQTLVDASEYYDRIRRLKDEKESSQK